MDINHQLLFSKIHLKHRKLECVPDAVLKKCFMNLVFIFRFVIQYKTMIEKSAAKLQITPNDIESTIMGISETSYKEYAFQHLAAANDFPNNTIIAWYNGQPLHAAALSLDLVHNALIKTMLGSDYGIHVTNQPLPYTPEKKSNIYHYDNFESTFSYIIGIMMSVYSASYVTYLIKV